MQEAEYERFRKVRVPTEEEVMAGWQGGSLPVVSVVCITYNQRDYIKDALRGFLLQKTDFPFEVIVHDDASTDGTREIIRAFRDEYPGIVRLILQSENQYSQGKKNTLVAAAKAKGEYVALCEGDDFWIGRDKLQRQVDFLRANPKHNLCFHRQKKYPDSASLKESFYELFVYPARPSVVSVGSLIIGDGGFVPTASIVVRRVALEGLPDWFYECPVGDFFIQVICSAPAGALFLPDRLSCYRRASNGSWSASVLSSAERRFFHVKRMVVALRRLDGYFSFKFRRGISILGDVSVLHELLRMPGGDRHKDNLGDLVSSSLLGRLVCFGLGEGFASCIVRLILLAVLVLLKGSRLAYLFFARLAGRVLVG